ncbi:MAG: dihydropteroate synthase [Bryobacterales bacterium]|nr:dihydropteroate synthase [Bryobacterales bacterium]
MLTEITSPQKRVLIGPSQPFVMIGERINPSGRKALAAEMVAGNFDRVRADALAQVAAGAQMLDVNAGIPLADEPAILAETIQIVQSVTNVPLCIDSSVIAALERGLAVYRGKPLVNSVTGEEERLDAVLPLVAHYKAAVVGVANDERAIVDDVDVRFEIARKIVERAERFGIPRHDVIIDPLAMPVGALANACVTFFELVRRLRDELGVNTVCGASNISFGLAERPTLNATFLSMAIGAGLTCAITNPVEEKIREAILASNVIMNRDRNCETWLATHRPASDVANPEASARLERRAARRAARATQPEQPSEPTLQSAGDTPS